MKKNIRAYVPYAGLLVCPAFTFLLVECYTHNPFTTMNIQAICLNLFFYWFVAALLLGLSGRVRLALMGETIFFALAGLANYYVLSFRSSPILPWDIYSYRTAASVADNFSYALPGKVWLVLLAFAILLAAEWLLGRHGRNRFFAGESGRTEGSRGWIVRTIAIILSLVLIMGMTALLHRDSFVLKMKLYDKLFTPDTMQRKDGAAVAFLMELRYLFVEKPEGYEPEAAASLLASYVDEEAEETRRPNVIVIMNEAFSDLGVLGDLICNEDYMPYIHSLEQGAEDTVTGQLQVSVLGGNTANTEFEFLTGSTMAFLPEGSVPYQQYLNGPLDALPSQLGAMGYYTVAMHPYRARGWGRDKVYGWMGFQKQVFLKDYEQPEYIRKYVSDKSCYDKIIEEYENRPAGQPFFGFNVTMQNHGGYSQEYEDFVSDISVAGIKSRRLSQYLSLIRLSDEAFRELTAYFAEVEEETVIVFFGDHQPSDTVASPIWKSQGKTKEDLTEEELSLRYQVPFVVWANFDIEEQSGLSLSTNYLAGLVLEEAGLPLSGYQHYLRELETEFPVISARQIVDGEGNVLTEEEAEESDALSEYRRLQYYQIFDRKKDEG